MNYRQSLPEECFSSAPSKFSEALHANSLSQQRDFCQMAGFNGVGEGGGGGGRALPIFILTFPPLLHAAALLVRRRPARAPSKRLLGGGKLTFKVQQSRAAFYSTTYVGSSTTHRHVCRVVLHLGGRPTHATRHEERGRKFQRPDGEGKRLFIQTDCPHKSSLPPPSVVRARPQLLTSSSSSFLLSSLAVGGAP